MVRPCRAPRQLSRLETPPIRRHGAISRHSPWEAGAQLRDRSRLRRRALPHRTAVSGMSQCLAQQQIALLPKWRDRDRVAAGVSSRAAPHPARSGGTERTALGDRHADDCRETIGSPSAESSLGAKEGCFYLSPSVIGVGGWRVVLRPESAMPGFGPRTRPPPARGQRPSRRPSGGDLRHRLGHRRPARAADWRRRKDLDLQSCLLSRWPGARCLRRRPSSTPARRECLRAAGRPGPVPGRPDRPACPPRWTRFRARGGG